MQQISSIFVQHLLLESISSRCIRHEEFIGSGRSLLLIAALGSICSLSWECYNMMLLIQETDCVQPTVPILYSERLQGVRETQRQKNIICFLWCYMIVAWTTNSLFLEAYQSRFWENSEVSSMLKVLLQNVASLMRLSCIKFFEIKSMAQK